MTFARNLRIVSCFTKLDSNTGDPRCYSVPSHPRRNRNLVHTYVCVVTHIARVWINRVRLQCCSWSFDQCLCVFFPFILDVKFVWVYQPESHRRKITQDFSSTFFLRCMSLFLASRIQPFLSLVDREVEICVRVNRPPHVWAFFNYSKSQLSGFELTSQRVRRFLCLVSPSIHGQVCSNIMPGFTSLGMCVCVCVFLPNYSGHQVRWTYQPRSHRRKVKHDFSPTFLLCLNFSREKDSAIPFPRRP